MSALEAFDAWVNFTVQVRKVTPTGVVNTAAFFERLLNLSDDDMKKDAQDILISHSLYARWSPQAQPFWVSREMSELIDVASESFPDNPVTPAEAPTPVGFVLFDRQFRGASEIQTYGSSKRGSDADDLFHGMFWWFQYGEHVPDLSPLRGPRERELDEKYGDGWRSGTILSIATLSTLQDMRDLGQIDPAELKVRLRSDTLIPSTFPYSVLTHLPLYEMPREDQRRLFKILRAFWALSQQTLARRRSEPAPRAAQRRSLRSGMDHVPEVQVITLRRESEQSSTHDDPAGAANWSHRWIVGGHWRNQWYPSQHRHVPIWIAPYIKGPENKPLVADRAYQLSR